MAYMTNKTANQIRSLITNVISLNNTEEFYDCSFDRPPEFWNDGEKRLCDYQGRIINELLRGLEKIFYARPGKRKRHSYTDGGGRLWVACSECERGGNGKEEDKCARGWKVRRYNKRGCFSGREIRGGTNE
jgi:hypothetical protein